MSEAVFIGCSRVDEPGDVYPGSTRVNCADCDAEVWVSPASMKAMVTGATAVCVPCVTVRASAPNAKFGVLPETVSEVRAWMSRN